MSFTTAWSIFCSMLATPINVNEYAYVPWGQEHTPSVASKLVYKSFQKSHCVHCSAQKAIITAIRTAAFILPFPLALPYLRDEKTDLKRWRAGGDGMHRKVTQLWELQSENWLAAGRGKLKSQQNQRKPNPQTLKNYHYHHHPQKQSLWKSVRD